MTSSKFLQLSLSILMLYYYNSYLCVFFRFLFCHKGASISSIFGDSLYILEKINRSASIPRSVNIIVYSSVNITLAARNVEKEKDSPINLVCNDTEPFV